MCLLPSPTARVCWRRRNGEGLIGCAEQQHHGGRRQGQVARLLQCFLPCDALLLCFVCILDVVFLFHISNPRTLFAQRHRKDTVNQRRPAKYISRETMRQAAVPRLSGAGR
jgi:hypothetical protein